MPSINAQLLSLLRSPHDGSKLRENGAALIDACDTGFPLIDGIPCFVPQPPVPITTVEVSVLILALNEEGNIGTVVTEAIEELNKSGLTFEIVVVDGDSVDKTREAARKAGARVVEQLLPGYAQGFLQGLREVRGRYLITLDGDMSHPAALIPTLLDRKEDAEVIIGSRWVKGGSFNGPFVRKLLSQLLNVIFRRALSLPVKDISSGYRLYRREILNADRYRSADFSLLEEILVCAYVDGFHFIEVPLKFERRHSGSSHVRLIKFALSYIRTLARMWMLRNKADGCDYDSRAYDTWLPPQRYWQRKRFKNIMELLGEYRNGGLVLDVGCGSSRVIQSLSHAIAYDISLKKLRFLKHSNPLRVCGSALALPFKDGVFDCVIHSQLVEFLPPDDLIFSELARVIRPGGSLIIGALDHASWTWPIIERIYGIAMPHSYAEEQITPYTLTSLENRLRQFGFEPKALRTILKGEITILAERT